MYVLQRFDFCTERVSSLHVFVVFVLGLDLI